MQEAIAIVLVDGPGSLSLREVQRRAGVSPAAAYRHFRDRDALLLAVAQEAAGALADHIAAALAAAPGPASEAPTSASVPPGPASEAPSAAPGSASEAPGPASAISKSIARARLLAACEGYLDFATKNPGLYRAVFYSDEQLDELTAPTERARGTAGEGGYNLLIAALQDVVTATGGTELNPWDPIAVWSACHGLAMLRLDAALRSLPDEQFAQARDRVFRTIVAAVPLEALTAANPPETA